MLRAIAYQSIAMPMLGAREVDAILVDAMACNGMEQVTGVLLFDGRRFFQYLEGEPAAIDRIYARIVASRKHHDVRVVFDEPVGSRYFWRWTMACRNVPPSAIQSLESAKWGRAFPAVEDDRQAVPGLGLLVDFWAAAAPV